MSKLLFITLNDHVSWGGSEELWSKAALEMVNQHHISIVKKQWQEEHDRIIQIEALGGKIHYKPKPKPYKKGILHHIKRKLKKPTPKPHDLEGVTKTQSFDLAILSVGNHVDANIISLTNYLKQHNIPYVLVVQLATSLRYLHDHQIEKLSLAYNEAKGVGYLSVENRIVLETQLGVSLNNIFKINNPFNYEQKYVQPESNDMLQVACVAAYTMFHKGQDLLLKVLSQDKWKTRNVCFNLYGSGVNEQHFKGLITRYELENTVVLKGHESNKGVIWKNNVACIMPSRMEGQSLAMLEAMSFGRMVISTAVGAAEELIEHGKTGFLAKAPTIELIDEALEQAWEKRDMWVAMGKASRDKLYEVVTEDPVDTFSNEINKLLK
ncbi:glycosyltransferase [Hanstruepera flava]|uniref:glycosyltransferase n=1 Tax=Hanstruepera flava TaxID=2930218 RepID=UPI00202961C6|nr:glycosyltransferase [Hanstruepera flava]